MLFRSWRKDRLPIPIFLGFPGGSDGKESACNAGDLGSIPGSGSSPVKAFPCAFLQGICSTQGSNPGLPHCRQILYQLSHQGSPRIWERIAYLFSRRFSQPGNQTVVSCIAQEAWASVDPVAFPVTGRAPGGQGHLSCPLSSSVSVSGRLSPGAPGL